MSVSVYPLGRPSLMLSLSFVGSAFASRDQANRSVASSSKGNQALGNPAIDRHASSSLDNGFEGSPTDCFGATGGNENYVVMCEFSITNPPGKRTSPTT